MKPRMTLLQLQQERDAHPTLNMKTRLRVKKTGRVVHIGPKVKMGMLVRRRRNKANTSQRKETNLEVAVKAEKRVSGPEAERKGTSIKVMTGEVALGAETEVLPRKRRSQILIRVRTERKVMSLRKRLKMRTKAELGADLGQSQRARRDQQQKRGTGLAAGTGTEVDVQLPKKKKKNETMTEKRPGSVAGVRKKGTTVKKRIRGGDHPGIRTAGQVVQTGASPETHTEADAPEAGATRETTAKTAHHIGGTETERAPTGGEGAAAAPTAIKTGKGRVGRAQRPKEEEREARPDQEAEKVQGSPNPIARKVKGTETTIRGINPAPAPALTATEPVVTS